MNRWDDSCSSFYITWVDQGENEEAEEEIKVSPDSVISMEQRASEESKEAVNVGGAGSPDSVKRVK